MGGAPASYLLHYLYGPPEYWNVYGEPVRVHSGDATLELLANPLLVEDIRFADLVLPASGKLRAASSLVWRVDPERVDAAAKIYHDLGLKVKMPEPEAA